MIPGLHKLEKAWEDERNSCTAHVSIAAAGFAEKWQRQQSGAWLHETAAVKHDCGSERWHVSHGRNLFGSLQTGMQSKGLVLIRTVLAAGKILMWHRFDMAGTCSATTALLTMCFNLSVNRAASFTAACRPAFSLSSRAACPTRSCRAGHVQSRAFFHSPT